MPATQNGYHRVVVTGLGVITSLGTEVQSFWNHLLAGTSGVTRISRFDPSIFDCQIGSEIKHFEPALYFKNPKDVRRCDPYTQFAMAAARQGLTDSGLDLSRENLERIGVIVGSGIGGIQSLEEQYCNLIQKGPSRVSPFAIPMMISNMASGTLSMEFGFSGPNFSVVTACSTSSHAAGESFHIIRRGEADVMLCGGSEACLCPVGLAGFSAMRALSTRNQEPDKASRPFDRHRDGFVMGEGAGILILEELEHAKKRGARIYAEILGYGNTADAYHMTMPSPQGRGAARCIQVALKNAGVNPEDIDYINAHGTSTPQGDLCETQAIKTVFGAHAKKLMVSSTKSMTGHLLGAAGSVELAICAKVLEEGKIPPTINLDDPDPDCDLDFVPHTAREKKTTRVMNNSFGFGGHNACMILKKFDNELLP